MSTNLSFYSIPKTITTLLCRCTSEDEVIQVARNNGIPCDNNSVSLHNFGKIVYDFGSYVSFADKIRNNNKPIFSHPNLQDLYYEYDFYVCDKDDFLLAIETYQEKIKNLYTDLLREKSIITTDTRTQEERIKSHIEDTASRWCNKSFSPINLDSTTPRINNSWLFEYAIFELVRCYKIFDWENNDLVFIGC